MSDRSENRRLRLGVVEVYDQHAGGVDQQDAVVIPERDGQDRHLLADCLPPQRRDDFGAIAVPGHVSQVTLLGQGGKQIYRPIAEPADAGHVEMIGMLMRYVDSGTLREPFYFFGGRVIL